MARLSVVKETIKSSKIKLTKIIVDQNSGFYESTRYILIAAQAFAVMPLCGLLSRKVDGKLDDLKFRWGSVNTIYSICCIISIGVMCGFSAVSTVFQGGLKIGKISPLIFYLVNFVILIQFFLLAKKWPALMSYWKSIEDTLPKNRNRPRICYSIHFFSIFILCISFVEHSMSIVSNLVNVIECYNGQHSITESFFRSHLGFIFNIIEYNFYLALFTKWMNIISTFNWSFMDLFIIIIAIGLSNMLRRLNGFLLRQDVFDKGEAFWAEQRKSYRKVYDLIAEVDDKISTLTLISFSNNLFFICLQLLNSLLEMPKLYEVYFWFSLSFLIARTCLIVITCSYISEESRKPLVVFRKIPSERWCLEVKRFFDEITSSSIGLTGKRYFRVTRGLLLTITGTIITYELILFNFNQDEDQNIGNCTFHPPIAIPNLPQNVNGSNISTENRWFH